MNGSSATLAMSIRKQSLRAPEKTRPPEREAYRTSAPHCGAHIWVWAALTFQTNVIARKSPETDPVRRSLKILHGRIMRRLSCICVNILLIFRFCHSRECGNPVLIDLDSRLRGNDKTLYLFQNCFSNFFFNFFD
jgi:hypothetical protein